MIAVSKTAVLLLPLMAMLGSASWTPAAAQPVVRDMLDRVEVERREGTVAMHVHFRFPARYARHFPYESGDTLLIQVTPTVLEPGRGNAPRPREALRPPNDPDVPVTDIVFDERTLWSPYLILHFSRRVHFRVSQGSDFRSVIIELPLAPAPPPGTSPPAGGRAPTP
jgi:hypothetical protein